MLSAHAPCYPSVGYSHSSSCPTQWFTCGNIRVVCRTGALPPPHSPPPLPLCVLQYLEPRPGNFVSIENGKVMGKHKGKLSLTGCSPRRTHHRIQRGNKTCLCKLLITTEVDLLLSFFLHRLVHFYSGPEGQDRWPERCLVCGGQRNHHQWHICGRFEISLFFIISLTLSIYLSFFIFYAVPSVSDSFWFPVKSFQQLRS